MAKILGNLFIDGEGTISDKTGTHNITNNGAILDTTTKRYGDSSIYFDGIDDIVSIPDHADFHFGSAPFTMDFWFNIKSYDMYGRRDIFITKQADGVSGNTNRWYFTHTNDQAQNYCGFGLTGLTPTEVSVPTGLIPLNTWHHIAVVRTGNNIILFVDGVASTPGTFVGDIPDFVGEPVELAYFNYTIQNPFYTNCYLDNIRVVKGQALWTSNFELTEEALFYKDTIVNPTRPDNIKGLYDISLKSGIRNAAKNGFVRPTLSEMFMTHKDFVEITSAEDIYFASKNYGVTFVNNDLTAVFNNYPTGILWGLGITNISKTSGKWYIEFLVNDVSGPTYSSAGIGIIDPNNYAIDEYSYKSPKSLFWIVQDGLLSAYINGYVCGGTIISANDKLALAFDMDNYNLKLFKNNVLIFSYTETEPNAKLDEFTFAGTGIGATLTVVPNKDSIYYSIPEGYKYFS